MPSKPPAATPPNPKQGDLDQRLVQLDDALLSAIQKIAIRPPDPQPRTVRELRTVTGPR